MAASVARDLDEMALVDARLWLAGPGRRLEDLEQGIVELFYDMDLVPLSTERERDEYTTTLEPPTNDRLESIYAPTLVVVW
jgi:hypothetical protein